MSSSCYEIRVRTASKSTGIAKQLSPKGRDILLDHTVIVLLQRIRIAAKPGVANVARGSYCVDALAFCREEIPRRARERGVQTFSMLIDTVHARLCSARGAAVFANTLFVRFPLRSSTNFRIPMGGSSTSSIAFIEIATARHAVYSR